MRASKDLVVKDVLKKFPFERVVTGDKCVVATYNSKGLVLVAKIYYEDDRLNISIYRDMEVEFYIKDNYEDDRLALVLENVLEDAFKALPEILFPEFCEYKDGLLCYY